VLPQRSAHPSDGRHAAIPQQTRKVVIHMALYEFGSDESGLRFTIEAIPDGLG